MSAVSTQTLREEYPEFIRSFSPLRCNYSRAVKVRFPAGGASFPLGYVDLLVHPAVKDATRALAAVMLFFGYQFEEMSGGTLSCRAITGGAKTSLHAHGVALDFNPSKNGYRTIVGHLDDPDTGHAEGLLQWGKYTDMPPAMIRDIKAIKTVAGQRIWAWGGDFFNIKDPMHFQPYCHRDDLEEGVDFSTVKGWGNYVVWTITGGIPMSFLPLEQGDGIGAKEGKRADVAAVQEMINEAFPTANLIQDGAYGEKTTAAVKKYIIKDGAGDGHVFYGNLWTNLLMALIDSRVRNILGAGIQPEFEVEKVSVLKSIRFKLGG